MAFEYKRRDPEKMKERATGGGKDFKGFLHNEYTIYAPKDGDNWIRPLPPTWDNADHWGIDVHVHYGVGPDNGAVLCNAKMWKTACPICEARQRAQKAGDEALAKELSASTRVLFWLLDRQEPTKGPLLWASPYTVDKEICALGQDKQTGEYYELDNPHNGFDVSFSKQGKGQLTKYSGYQVGRRETSVPSEALTYIQENPLHGTLVERSYEEVKQMFEGFLPPPPTNDSAPSTTTQMPGRRTIAEASSEQEDNIPWERIDSQTGEVTQGTGTPPAVTQPAARRALPASPAPAPATATGAAPSTAASRAAALRERFAKK
jgi:hypothetical protein